MLNEIIINWYTVIFFYQKPRTFQLFPHISKAIISQMISLKNLAEWFQWECLRISIWSSDKNVKISNCLASVFSNLEFFINWKSGLKSSKICSTYVFPVFFPHKIQMCYIFILKLFSVQRLKTNKLRLGIFLWITSVDISKEQNKKRVEKRRSSKYTINGENKL